MKIYLEPKGWPRRVETAPNGLVIRTRKGKVYLYLKTRDHDLDPEGSQIYDEEGNLTTVTGLVTPVKLKVEE